MKIKELISHVNTIKPHPYPDEVLLTWINDCEAKVKVEIEQAYPNTVKEYKLPEDEDKELFLPRPYDEIYSLYLQAYIDFQMQEIESYNSIMTMYNNALNEAKKYYVRTGDKKRERIRVYL